MADLEQKPEVTDGAQPGPAVEGEQADATPNPSSSSPPTADTQDPALIDSDEQEQAATVVEESAAAVDGTAAEQPSKASVAEESAEADGGSDNGGTPTEDSSSPPPSGDSVLSTKETVGNAGEDGPGGSEPAESTGASGEGGAIEADQEDAADAAAVGDQVEGDVAEVAPLTTTQDIGSISTADEAAAKLRNVPTSPLTFTWVLGFNCHLTDAVHYLADNEREEIFYPAGHIGLLFAHVDHDQALLQGHRNGIVATASSTDKRWLATADAGPDAVTIVWDTISGEPVRTWFDTDLANVAHIAFSADGTLLAVLSGHGENGHHQCMLSIWDWSDGGDEPLAQRELLLPQGIPRRMTFHPETDLQLLVTRNSEVDRVQWTVEDGMDVTPLRPKGVSTKTLGTFVHSLYIPATSQAITTTDGGYVVLWDVDSAECLKYIKIFDSAITSACMTPDGRTFVGGGQCGTIRYYDTDIRLVGWNDDVVSGPITSISFTNAKESGYGRRRSSLTALGLEKNELDIPNYVVGTSNGNIVLVTTDQAVTSARQILATHAAEVRALAPHPTQPYLAISGYSGVLQVWDYSLRADVVSARLADGVQVSALCYSPSGDAIVVGSAAGGVSVIDAISLTESTSTSRFNALSDVITHIKFSLDGSCFAVASADHYVGLFRAGKPEDPENSDGVETQWLFVGKYQSHSARISDLCFGADVTGESRLVSLGEDRMLVEYDLEGSTFGAGLLLKGKRTQIEQSAVPLTVNWHPRIDAEEFFVVTNSELKSKLYNTKTKQCRKTVLGPHRNLPVDHVVIPPAYPNADSTRVCAYAAGDSVGMMLLPFDGNAHRSMSVVGHGAKVTALVSSHDGRYLFTAGGGSVHMWSTHTHILEAAAKLGGVGVEPFLELVEGGREGELFIDMEDFFYYAQLESQGLNTMGTREVSDRLALEHVPRVFRALGYYPTEQEISNVINEVKFSRYLDTKTHVMDVDIETLVRLFVNHRPAKGLSMENIEGAFATLTHGVDGISIEDLLTVLQTSGEHVSEEELARHFSVLLSGQRLKDVLPPAITAANFSSGVLGF